MKPKEQKYREAVERNLKTAEYRLKRGSPYGIPYGALSSPGLAKTKLGIRQHDSEWDDRVSRLTREAADAADA